MVAEFYVDDLYIEIWDIELEDFGSESRGLYLSRIGEWQINCSRQYDNGSWGYYIGVDLINIDLFANIDINNIHDLFIKSQQVLKRVESLPTGEVLAIDVFSSGTKSKCWKFPIPPEERVVKGVSGS